MLTFYISHRESGLAEYITKILLGLVYILRLTGTHVGSLYCAVCFSFATVSARGKLQSVWNPAGGSTAASGACASFPACTGPAEMNLHSPVTSCCASNRPWPNKHVFSGREKKKEEKKGKNKNPKNGFELIFFAEHAVQNDWNQAVVYICNTVMLVQFSSQLILWPSPRLTGR